MNTNPNIVAVCGDPGGAEALAPVLAALGQMVHSYAYRQASAVLAACGLARQVLSETTNEADCAEILQQETADLLLTSTSVNGVELERKFIAAARSLGVPSLAVLDYWTNYRRRFSDADGEMFCVSDRVAVMDARARDEMIADGFAAEQLVVTGQPAFDEVAAWKRAAPPELRSSMRRALGVHDAELLVVFASQPVAAVVGADVNAPGHPGYTESIVLPLLVAALESLARETGRAVTLLVRPHPRENESDFAKLSSTSIRLFVSSAFHRREIALAADVVAGMNSAFLVEACYLGCVTLSLQPGLRLPESLPTVRAGLTRAVYEPREIQPALAELLFTPESSPCVQRTRREVPSTQGATDKIVALIHEMLQQPAQIRVR